MSTSPGFAASIDLTVSHYDRWHYLDEKRAALAIWEHHLRAVLAGHTEAAGKVVALRS